MTTQDWWRSVNRPGYSMRLRRAQEEQARQEALRRAEMSARLAQTQPIGPPLPGEALPGPAPAQGMESPLNILANWDTTARPAPPPSQASKWQQPVEWKPPQPKDEEPIIAPSWFAPPDTFLGGLQRDLLRPFIPALRAARHGETAEAAWKAATGAYQSTTASLLPEAVEAFRQQPSVGTGLAVGASALGAGLIGAMPRALLPVLSAGTQAVEGVLGSISNAVPRPTGLLGEIAKETSGPAIWSALSDPGKTARRWGELVEKARKGEMPLLAWQPSIDQHARDFQALLGQDYTAEQRAKRNWLQRPFRDADDPAVFAAYETRNIVFSDREAQKRAVERILAGEDVTTVLRSKRAPGKDAFEDEINEWNASVKRHLLAVERIARAKAMQNGLSPEQAEKMAIEAREERARFINAHGLIPGEEDPIKEAIGQTIIGLTPLDPINKVPLGKLFGVQRFFPKRVAVEAAQFLDEVYDDMAKNAAGYTIQQRVEAAMRGVSPKTVERLQRAEAVLSDPTQSLLKKAAAKVYVAGTKAREFTTATRAHIMNGEALDVVNTLTLDAATPQEAVTRLTRFITDPDQMLDRFGNMPISVRAQIARPVVAKTIEKLGGLESLKEPVFNPLKFMAEYSALAEEAAKEVTGYVPISKRGPIERFSYAVKSWMSEFYLRNPGYIWRNAMSDAAIMLQDGVMSLEKYSDVTKYLDNFGIWPQELSGRSVIDDPRAATKSKFTRWPILGPIQDKLGEISTNLEDARRVRAFYSAFRKLWDQEWRPRISSAVRDQLGQDYAPMLDRIEAALRGATNPKQLRATFERMTSPKSAADSFSILKPLQDAGISSTSASPELLARMEKVARELIEQGADDAIVNQTFKQFDDLIAEKQGLYLAQLGEVVNPRRATERMIAQDVDEYQAIAQGAISHLVKSGVMTPDDAARAINELLGELVEGEVQIRQARERLGRALAGLDVGDVKSVQRIAAVMQYAANDEYALRNTYRLKQSEFLKAAIAKVKEARSKKDAGAMRAAWDAYRTANSENARQMQRRIAERLDWVSRAFGDVASEEGWARIVQEAGEDLSVIQNRVDALIEEARKMLDVEDAQFVEKVTGSRYSVDKARQEAYRRATVIAQHDPSLTSHVFDVLTQAEDDVQRDAIRVVALNRGALQQKDLGAINLDEYQRVVSENWDKHFEYARKRYGDYASTQLVWVQVRHSPLANALRRAGKTDDEIARLFAKFDTPEGRQAIEEALRAPAQPATREAAKKATETQPAKAYDPDQPVDPETLARYQDASVEQVGMQEGIHIMDFVDAAAQEELAAVRAIREAVKKHIAQGDQRAGAVMTSQARKLLEEEMKRIMREYYQQRLSVTTQARELTNFALLDYAKKRNFDTYLQLVAPFAYWGTRQGRNYFIRFMRNPQLLVNYWRWRQAIEKENERANRRGRFKSSIMIPAKDILGSDVFVDPFVLLFPYSTLINTDLMDAEQARNGLQEIYRLASMFGIQPSPIIDVPLRYSNLLVSRRPGEEGYEEEVASFGRSSIGQLILATGAIQGATAALGIGGPTGIDIERPIRRAAGMPEAERWDAYRISRSISDLATVENLQVGPDMDKRPYLLAQEFVRRHRDTDLPSALEYMTPAALARELEVNEELAARALDIARRAALMATQQRGFTQLASFLGGVRAQQLPEPEKARMEMRALERAAAYNPATEMGSREEVRAVQAAFPALAVQRGQYGALPGDERDYSWLYRQTEREMINRHFDALKDAVIAQRPWDRRAAQDIERMRWQELQRVQGDQGVVETFAPRSVAGASPREVIQTRKEEIMRLVLLTQPSIESYTRADGEVDFAAYRQAVEEWKKRLPEIVEGIPQVGMVLERADKDGVGGDVRRWLSKINAEYVGEYRRRNDTALEAAQRMYFEQVYEPAMDQYRKLKEAGDDDAWEKTIMAVGAVTGDRLIPYIKRIYGDKFGEQELEQVRGLVFPPLDKVVSSGLRGEALRAHQAKTEFWRTLREMTPPGSDSYEMRKIPLVAAALDKSTRTMLTAEQFELATAMMRGWVIANYGEPTPELLEEWRQAREEKSQLDALIGMTLGIEAVELLKRYELAPTAELKERVRYSSPLVPQALAIRRQFAAAHPVYAKYFRAPVRMRRRSRR